MIIILHFTRKEAPLTNSVNSTHAGTDGFPGERRKEEGSLWCMLEYRIKYQIPCPRPKIKGLLGTSYYEAGLQEQERHKRHWQMLNFAH